LVRGVNAPLPPERRKLRKFDYEMVHCEVYLNKYVVSIAPFSTSAPCPMIALKILHKYRKLLFFACFRFLIFHPFFQLAPICPHVRTPVTLRVWLQLVNSTHPSQITRLYEMPEIFDDSATQNAVREQLTSGRTLQQEIDVRVSVSAVD